jgi:hypothetical protein
MMHHPTIMLPTPLLGLLLGIFYLSGLLLLGIHHEDRLVLQSLLAGVRNMLGKG